MVSEVIHPSAPQSAWPALGATVRLTRYAEGNTLRGDHTVISLFVTGVVTETPARGSNYLSVEPDEYTQVVVLPEMTVFDKEDPEAWSISRDKVTLHRKEFWRWTCEVLAPPEPKVPLTIEVGDRVSYTPRWPVRENDPASELWHSRAERVYTVTELYDQGNGVTEATCHEVTPNANRHNPIRRDHFYAKTTDLRLVAKATYAPIS